MDRLDQILREDLGEEKYNKMLKISQKRSIKNKRQQDIKDNKNNEAGYIYIASNLSFPGILKIGLTRSVVTRRLFELSRYTPADYKEEMSIRVKDPYAAEASVHKLLAESRVDPGKELFRADLETAMQAVEEICLVKESTKNQTPQEQKTQKPFSQ